MCLVPVIAALKFSPGSFLVLHSSEDRRGANIAMKSFATTAVALLGLASSASALFTTNSSLFGNQAGSDLGCFNTFESTNSQAIDVCLIGLLGGAFFIYFIGPSIGMNIDTQG